MIKPVLDEIIELIDDKIGIGSIPVTFETTLEKDLGMSGDDALEFIAEVGLRFNVDVSAFQFSKYFYSEGDVILPGIIIF